MGRVAMSFSVCRSGQCLLGGGQSARYHDERYAETFGDHESL